MTEAVVRWREPKRSGGDLRRVRAESAPRPTGVLIASLVGLMAAVLVSCGDDSGNEIDFTAAQEDDGDSINTETTPSTPPEAETPAEEPAIDDEELIRNLNELHHQIWLRCTDAPSDCDPAVDFAETSTGDVLANTAAFVEEMQAAGQVARHPDGAGADDFFVTEAVEINQDSTAVATTCSRDSRGLFTGPGDDLTLVEGTAADAVEQSVWSYVVEDDEWKIQSVTVLKRSVLPEEEPVCEP